MTIYAAKNMNINRNQSNDNFMPSKTMNINRNQSNDNFMLRKI